MTIRAACADFKEAVRQRRLFRFIDVDLICNGISEMESRFCPRKTAPRLPKDYEWAKNHANSGTILR